MIPVLTIDVKKVDKQWDVVYAGLVKTPNNNENKNEKPPKNP